MTSNLVFSSIWSLALLILSLRIPESSSYKVNKNPRLNWLIIFFAALIARIIPNQLLPVGAVYDIDSYRIVANLILDGKDVYTNTETENRHPYLPLQMYWMAFSQWISIQFDLAFVKVVRLAPILADSIIPVFLYRILCLQTDRAKALRAGLSYAFNPISIYVCSYHGQFDAIPALFTLLAFSAVEKSTLVAGSWLGTGILIKSWPILAFPTLLSNQKSYSRRLIFVAVTILVPIIGIVLYTNIFDSQLIPVVRRAVSYDWGIGNWGYTYIVRLLSLANNFFIPIFMWLVKCGRYITVIILSMVFWWRARHESAESGFLTLIVAFYAFTHAFSIQYLMWVLPFAYLDLDFLWLRRYIIGAFAYMFLAYNTYILSSNITNLLPLPQADWFIIMAAGLPVWLVCVGWAYQRIFRIKGNPYPIPSPLS